MLSANCIWVTHSVPGCLSDYLVRAQKSLQSIVLCKVGFFWVSNLSSMEILQNSTKSYLQGQVSKQRESWGSSTERILSGPGCLGIQGVYVLVQGHWLPLFFIIWSKREKIACELGEQRELGLMQSGILMPATDRSGLGIPAAQHLESLVPMGCYILSCQGTATTCAVGSWNWA